MGYLKIEVVHIVYKRARSRRLLIDNSICLESVER